MKQAYLFRIVSMNLHLLHPAFIVPQGSPPPLLQKVLKYLLSFHYGLKQLQTNTMLSLTQHNYSESAFMLH